MSGPLTPAVGLNLPATTDTPITFSQLIYEYELLNYSTTIGVYWEEDTPASPGSPYLPPAVSATQPSVTTRRCIGLGALHLYPTGAGLVINDTPGAYGSASYGTFAWGPTHTGLVIRGYLA